MFTAAVIAFRGEDPRRIEQVCAAVEATPETARGFVSAVVWTPSDHLHGKVAGLLESPSPLWRRVGIAAYALHRVDSGKYLSQAIEDPDPRLQARALRAAGETARRDLLPILRRRIRSEDSACQPLGRLVGGAARRPRRKAGGAASHRIVALTSGDSGDVGVAARPTPRPMLAIGSRPWRDTPNAGRTSSSGLQHLILPATP